MRQRNPHRLFILNPLVSIIALLLMALGIGCSATLKARLDESGIDIAWKNSAPTTLPVASR